MNTANQPSSPSTVQLANMAKRTLADIWSKVLGVPDINLDDDFFALGGNSVKLLEMIALARRSGLQITPHEAFENSTIAKLANACQTGLPKPELELVREVVFGNRAASSRCYLVLTSGEDLPIVQKLASHRHLSDVALHVLMPLWRETQPYIPAAEITRRFVRLIQRRAPDDHIVIAGHSAAGSVAARVAVDATQRGRVIKHLILLESTAPEPSQRFLRLDDLMPIDRTAPNALLDLRQEMARISKLRSADALSPDETMTAAWRAVSAEAPTLLSLIYGPAAWEWAADVQTEAARNFMAWLNLVVSLNEPLPHQLPSKVPITLVLNTAMNDLLCEELRNKWQEALGAAVLLRHHSRGHRALLHSEEFTWILASSFPT
jgi:thioesterase domain-containing protein